MWKNPICEWFFTVWKTKIKYEATECYSRQFIQFWTKKNGCKAKYLHSIDDISQTCDLLICHEKMDMQKICPKPKKIDACLMRQ